MLDWTGRPTRVIDLYVRLSAWLIPSFLLTAFVGLSLLSAQALSMAEKAISTRVSDMADEAAAAIGADAAATSPSTGGVLRVLLADPSILCAGLRDSDGAQIEIAGGIDCEGRSAEHRTSVEIAPGRATLVLGWTTREVRELREARRQTALVIVAAGVSVMLLANWLAFRIIIGRPLNDLIARMDHALNRAEHSALHDSLTGLANRRQFDGALGAALSEARRTGDIVTVLHLDLDGFKTLNDTHGHAAGDSALIRVAEHLTHGLDPADLAARIGGDEFIVLLGHPSTEARAAALAEDFIARLAEPLEAGGEWVRLGASIGIAAVDPAAAWSRRLPLELLADADTALYEAKALGRGQWVLCTDEMRAAVEQRRRLAEEIASAIEKGEFVVHYQPQFDGRGERLAGVEALVRWRHPRDGLLLPEKFVGLAEELHLLDRIDRMVCARALADLRAWDAAGLGVPRVSVNVSARRLGTAGLVADVRALAPPPGRLVFEVLESTGLERRSPHMAWNLEALRGLGIEIEIDDFGTGHSSIASVLAIHPARLKVAREIIQTFADDGDKAELVGALVALGRSLGVGLVAEGVETEAQLGAIREMGFDMIQGFALAEPMRADELGAFLARRTPPAREG